MWPAADNGVFNTGKCFARVSHNRICPEYVPPKMRFEWNGENVTESTSDCTKVCMTALLTKHRRTHLRMEDKFRPFKEMHVPDRNDTIWFVQRSWILVV